MRRTLPFALLLALCARGAAHYAPSPTENNRYAKITLLPGEVAISYTVLFGERPGAAERRRMDENRDGLLGDDEKARYGKDLLADLQPALEVELDGGPAAAAWRVVDVGLGTPVVAAGTFAVDLELRAPLPDPSQARHRLWLEDRWPVPSPGETEVRVAESPGVHVVESHVKRDGRGASLDFAFRGASLRPGDRGILVVFDVDEGARRAAPGPAAGGPPRKHWRAWAMLTGAAALAAIAGAVWLWEWWRKRSAGGKPPAAA